MVTLKDLLTIVSDPFYLNAVSPAPGVNDPRIRAINGSGHAYDPEEIAAGEDSLPEDFLDWEATIQPWDCETLLVTLRQPRRER